MSSTGIYDQTVLLESLGDDMELYAEIVQLFLKHTPAEVDALKRELASGNAANLQRTAHSVKGAVSNFSATRATEAARALELATKSNGFTDHTPALVEETIAAVEELLAALKADSA